MQNMERPDYFFCDTPPESIITSDMLLDGIDTLKRNAEQFLHSRDVNQQISLIEELVNNWTNEMFPLRCELLDQCGKNIRFSREIMAHGLNETFKTLTRTRLYQLLRIELGETNALDNWYKHLQSEDAPSHSSQHFSFRLVGCRYQQPSPGHLIVFMAKALLAKTALWIIAGPETIDVARAIAHSIYLLDPKAASCIEVATEEQMHPHLDVFRKSCDFYRHWKQDSVLNLQNERKLGFVWISADYIQQNGMGSIVRNIANDITAWDQFYPHAPHNIFVQQKSGHVAEDFAQRLFDTLNEISVEYPQTRFTPEGAANLRRFRNAFKLRQKMNTDTLVFENGTEESPGCSVIYEQEAKFSPSIGNRFVFVHPIVDLEELLHIMEPHRASIGCAALAVTPEQSASTARTMALWGIPRITSTGMMHRPCIFKEGGMPGLGELTYKAFWEKKYSE